MGFIEDYAVSIVLLIGVGVMTWMVWPGIIQGTPRYSKHRTIFMLGLVMLTMGTLLIPADILAGQGSGLSLITALMGILWIIIGLVNRDKW
jgi:hypothetical protein